MGTVPVCLKFKAFFYRFYRGKLICSGIWFNIKKFQIIRISECDHILHCTYYILLSTKHDEKQQSKWPKSFIENSIRPCAPLFGPTSVGGHFRDIPKQWVLSVISEGNASRTILRDSMEPRLDDGHELFR